MSIYFCGEMKDVFIEGKPSHPFNCFAAFWIVHRALKVLFDHEDNLFPCQYDVTFVRKTMCEHFNVSKLNMFYIHTCFILFIKSESALKLAWW